jgi:hypothetical protein
LPFLTDEDPLGVEEFATHRLPLADAAKAYEVFQNKEDGAIKIISQAVGISRIASRGIGRITE